MSTAQAETLYFNYTSTQKSLKIDGKANSIEA